MNELKVNDNQETKQTGILYPEAEKLVLGILSLALLELCLKVFKDIDDNTLYNVLSDVKDETLDE